MQGCDVMEQEMERISRFIKGYVLPQETVVVPVSGGLDSDVVARLCVHSLGNARVKLFVVKQTGMEEHYLKNIRILAEDLDVPLSVIELGDLDERLIQILEKAEKGRLFSGDNLLDTARAKCSLRSAIISSYQDKGYLIAGSTNRSEQELGFFMPFGDNLAHFKPIVHLYKTQVRLLAVAVGTRENVIAQKPSAGFWEGQEDLEDIAFWIVNNGPIVRPRVFTDEEVDVAMNIKAELTQEKIDRCLAAIAEGKDMDSLVKRSGLTPGTARGLRDIVEKAKWIKNRPLMERITI